MNNNIKLKEVTNRGLSLAAALAMGAFGATVSNNAEAETYSYGDAILVQQEMHEKNMTMEEFAIDCNATVNYLKQFIDYDHIQQDTQCLYYLTNIEYIPQELKEELISKGIVYNVNLETNEGIELLMNAYNLINMIADYNQSQIRQQANTTPESIIDVSCFCYDEHDAKLVSNMHSNYFYAYKNGKFLNDYYTKVFKQLTTLNAYEHEGNASELSVGARWIAQNSIGGGVMQLLRDDMQQDFTQEELYSYFDRTQLNMGQWILRDDLSFDFNCLSEHEYEVFNFGQLWVFVYDNVNNDMFRELENVRLSCTSLCDNPCPTCTR